MLLFPAKKRRKKRKLTLGAFFVRYDVVGCGLILHEYDHMLHAIIESVERLRRRKVELRLRSVHRAQKRKGHALLGPFKRGRALTLVVNTGTFEVEALGDGTFHLWAPKREMYGFITPKARVFVASSQKHGPRLKTAPSGNLRLVANG